MKRFIAILASGVSALGLWQGTQSAIALPLADAPVDIAQSAMALQGDWQLLGWGNPDDLVAPLEGTEITAQFEGDRLAGSAGCNNYVTTFEAMDGELTLNEIATTLRACEDPIADQEQQLLGALSSVNTYEFAGDRLVLPYETETASGVLVFERPAAIPGLW